MIQAVCDPLCAGEAAQYHRDSRVYVHAGIRQDGHADTEQNDGI